jgi:hypothetical protein
MKFENWNTYSKAKNTESYRNVIAECSFSNNFFSTNLNRFSLFEWIRWGPRLPWRPSTRGCSSGPCPWSPTSSFLITTPVIQLWLLVPFRFVDFERSFFLLFCGPILLFRSRVFGYFLVSFLLLFFHSLFKGLFNYFTFSRSFVWFIEHPRPVVFLNTC